MTLPQEVSEAPDSDPALAYMPTPPDGLICPAEQILDIKAVCAAVDAAAGETEDGKALRSAVVKILREARKSGNAAIVAAFEAEPFAARQLTRSYPFLTDCLVMCAHHVATPSAIRPNRKIGPAAVRLSTRSSTPP